MKANAMQPYSYYTCRRTPHRYPNCASRRYFLDKLLDTLLAAGITLSIITILLFLLVLI